MAVPQINTLCLPQTLALDVQGLTHCTAVSAWEPLPDAAGPAPACERVGVWVPTSSFLVLLHLISLGGAVSSLSDPLFHRITCPNLGLFQEKFLSISAMRGT